MTDLFLITIKVIISTRYLYIYVYIYVHIKSFI